MAILSYALTDTATIATQLGKTLTAGETTILENMINQATQYAEKYIGRFIKGRGEDLTEVLDIEEKTDVIFTKNFPIISITSITEDEEVISTDDYYEYSNTGMLRKKDANWTKGFQIVSIVYQGGYATVPEDIAQWCVNLVITMFKDKDRGNITSEKVGDLAVSYGEVGAWINKNSFSQKVLDTYKSNFL